MQPKSHFVDGRWLEGTGAALASHDPATGHVVWEGRGAAIDEVNAAVESARKALESWSDLGTERRIGFLLRFAAQLQSHRAELSEVISRETGKPRWEALTEVDSMIGKAPLSIEAFNERRRPVEREAGGATVATRFKPHGVVAVFGPFNFPGHLPNGHVVPALLAGNTVVFKPSELTPAVAQKTVELWQDAGLPAGALNLVQGGRETGSALAAHPGIDGLFFTGSAAVGQAISKSLADHPEKILALEMGGNNALIVQDVGDLEAAAYVAVQSAFLTAGQRCTCARRLIAPSGAAGDAFIDQLRAMTERIRVGAHTDDPEPFMGPVISRGAADSLLAAQSTLQREGGRTILEMRRIGSGGSMLSPGLIDVTNVPNRPDVEVFGPLLQIIRVPDFPAAIAEANNTAYGLAAGLLSDNRELYQQFFRKIRAGVVNWNRPTTGASGSLPFGGIGLSGNHRPSGYYAADYCSYPVASMEQPELLMPSTMQPGIRR